MPVARAASDAVVSMEEALLRAPAVRATPPTPDKEFEATHQAPDSPASDIDAIQQAINRGRKAHSAQRAHARLRDLAGDPITLGAAAHADAAAAAAAAAGPGGEVSAKGGGATGGGGRRGHQARRDRGLSERTRLVSTVAASAAMVLQLLCWWTANSQDGGPGGRSAPTQGWRPGQMGELLDLAAIALWGWGWTLLALWLCSSTGRGRLRAFGCAVVCVAIGAVLAVAKLVAVAAESGEGGGGESGGSNVDDGGSGEQGMPGSWRSVWAGRLMLGMAIVVPSVEAAWLHRVGRRVGLRCCARLQRRRGGRGAERSHVPPAPPAWSPRDSPHLRQEGATGTLEVDAGDGAAGALTAHGGGKDDDGGGGAGSDTLDRTASIVDWGEGARSSDDELERYESTRRRDDAAADAERAEVWAGYERAGYERAGTTAAGLQATHAPSSSSAVAAAADGAKGVGRGLRAFVQQKAAAERARDDSGGQGVGDGKGLGQKHGGEGHSKHSPSRKRRGKEREKERAAKDRGRDGAAKAHGRSKKEAAAAGAGAGAGAAGRSPRGLDKSASPVRRLAQERAARAAAKDREALQRAGSATTDATLSSSTGSAGRSGRGSAAAATGIEASSMEIRASLMAGGHGDGEEDEEAEWISLGVDAVPAEFLPLVGEGLGAQQLQALVHCAFDAVGGGRGTGSGFDDGSSSAAAPGSTSGAAAVAARGRGRRRSLSACPRAAQNRQALQALRLEAEQQSLCLTAAVSLVERAIRSRSVCAAARKGARALLGDGSGSAEHRSRTTVGLLRERMGPLGLGGGFIAVFAHTLEECFALAAADEVQIVAGAAAAAQPVEPRPPPSAEQLAPMRPRPAPAATAGRTEAEPFGGGLAVGGAAAAASRPARGSPSKQKRHKEKGAAARERERRRADSAPASPHEVGGGLLTSAADGAGLVLDASVEVGAGAGGGSRPAWMAGSVLLPSIPAGHDVRARAADEPAGAKAAADAEGRRRRRRRSEGETSAAKAAAKVRRGGERAGREKDKAAGRKKERHRGA